MKTLIITGAVVLTIVALLALRVTQILGQTVVKDPSGAAVAAGAGATTRPASPLDFTVKDIDGKDYDLAQLKGKVVMLVNVASKCGFTPQYKGLEETYEKYKDQGLVIVGVPANNFKSQEPGTDEEIKTFCTSKYNVTFPMLSKISVKGDDQHPLYKLLTQDSGDFKGDIGWNFTKFLIDRTGQIYARFPSKTTPQDPQVTNAIEKGLAAK